MNHPSWDAHGQAIALGGVPSPIAPVHNDIAIAWTVRS